MQKHPRATSLGKVDERTVTRSTKWQLARIFAVLLAVTTAMTLRVLWNDRVNPQARPSPAGVQYAGAQKIQVLNGGDPYSHEAANLTNMSYLSQATPGQHSDEFCFIRSNGSPHKVEISALLWGITVMESDKDLYFSKEQVTRLIPMMTRTIDGYNRAREIEARQASCLTRKQLEFVQNFVQTDRAKRADIDEKVTFRPKREMVPRQDPFLWKGHELLRERLGKTADLPLPAWRDTPPLSPGAPVVATPDFYWAMVSMIFLRPDLAPDKKQALRLYAMADEHAAAILDYESFTEDYVQVFRPDQKQFLLSMVPQMNHVFPP